MAPKSKAKAPGKAPTAAAGATTLPDIGRLLDAAQTSTAGHKALSKQLQGICKTQGPEQLTSSVLQLLQPVMLVSKKDAGTERVVRFLRTFCLELQDDAVTTSLILGCLTFCQARDKTVRYRACQIVGQLMDTLTAEDETEEEDPVRAALYAKLVETMKLCLLDSNLKVRSMAVNALYRLHDAEDASDDVLQALLLAMAEDSCHEVRRMVLKKVVVTSVTLLHILRMTRDVCNENRRLAYTTIRNDINFSKMSIAQRVLLLRDGLTDRDAEVQKAAQDMLVNGWLKAVGLDPIKMLGGLDVEAYHTYLTAAIDCMIDHQQSRARLPARKVEPAGDGDVTNGEAEGGRGGGTFKFNAQRIDSESVLYWHRLCLKLKAEGREEELDAQLPTLSEFCDLVLALFFQQAGSHEETVQVAEKSDKTFILTQLLNMCPLFDLGDEAGRRKLLAVLLQLLHVFDAEEPGQYVKPLMAALRSLFQDARAEYCQTVEVAIAKLRGAEEPKMTDVTEVEIGMEEQNRQRQQKQQERDTLVLQCQKLQRRVAQDPEDLEAKAHLQDLAAQLQELETQLFHDEIVWQRCLHVVIDFLEHMSRAQKRGIPDFISRTVLAATQQQSTGGVFELALWALNLWCHLDLTVVSTHLPIFVGAAGHPELFVREKALQCLVDIVLVWGVPAIRQQARRLARISGHSEAGSCVPNASGRDDTASGQDAATSSSLAEAPSSSVDDALAVIAHLLAFGHCRPASSGGPPNADHIVSERCLQAIACEGVAKLLSCNRWPELPERALAQLLLHFYNPTLVSKVEGAGMTGYADQNESISDDEDNADDEGTQDEQATVEKASSSMRQCLAVFFHAYAFASPQRQAVTLRASVIALRHLLRGSHVAVPLPEGASQPATAIRPPARQPQLVQFLKHALYLTDCQNLKAAGRDGDPLAAADEAGLPPPPRRPDLLRQHSAHEALLTAFLAEVVSDPNLPWRLPGPFRSILCGARLYAPPESLAAQKLACLVDQLADAFRQGSLRLDALTATALTKVQGHLNQAREAMAGDPVAVEAAVRADAEEHERYVATHFTEEAPPREEAAADRRGKRRETEERSRAPRGRKRKVDDLPTEEVEDKFDSLADEEARRKAALTAASAEPAALKCPKAQMEAAVKKRSSTLVGPPPPPPKPRSPSPPDDDEGDDPPLTATTKRKKAKRQTVADP